MKRLCLAATMLSVLSLAHADSPHFISATGTLDRDHNYVASFKEAGLGSTQTINYTLSSDANFVFQCFTKSDNRPQGEPNAGGSGNLTVPATFSSGKNGQITGSIMITPEVGGASCQGAGLKLCLVSVSYQNVVLTDTTNSISQSLPAKEETLSEPDCTL